ncbi:peptide chain release factor 2 [Kamptonema cortianum]|nr:peptide chain release factor 2 [Geitlerinema splendidum]MDK3155624.1 peptide chain release factor 2 [Kamptonema cortianum]
MFDWDAAQSRLQELENEVLNPTFWDDPERAQKIMRERDQLALASERILKVEKELKDAIELIELGEAENDADILQAGEKDIEKLHHLLQRLRLETLLSGEADANNCFIEIHAGAGGTEAQDWALMLTRMYTRWAETKGYKIEWIEESPGEEAGLKSATFKICVQKGADHPYGWLKGESGIHRLVRISPFDANARRHTSFASVWAYPEVDDNIDIQIEDKDLRVDTYRASGAGGQHVNKTDSAIRITHLPTGIVVQCQNDRSQHRNRAQAMSMLKARLYEHELKKREEAAQASEANKAEIGWGHQIRSYVLQPYQMVKDLRTHVEKGNAHGVLEGDIDAFLEATLAQKITSS